ncbi:D-galactonate transporter [Candidatus Burkholderia pumila]|uniref:D-galactonate transporter n=1 Tax=Candidatus Burkholderia pumila TaxID=1090375 RepID=A0ABR5HND8_9BURK|nr:D-galactonate transporter [Candidatus Burkholderia pumila]
MLDRFGARIMLRLGMFVWSVAQLFGDFVTTLQQFLVARIALGIGEALQFPAGAKVVSEWFTQRERGKPTDIFVTSSTIGPARSHRFLPCSCFRSDGEYVHHHGRAGDCGVD